MTHNDILTDPRWDADPVALWDELLEREGYDRALKVWMEACRECDAAAVAPQEEQ